MVRQTTKNGYASTNGEEKFERRENGQCNSSIEHDFRSLSLKDCHNLRFGLENCKNISNLFHTLKFDRFEKSNRS